MRWTLVSLGATILTLQIADTVDAAALEPNRIDVEYAPAQFVSLWFREHNMRPATLLTVVAALMAQPAMSDIERRSSIPEALLGR